MDAARRLDGRRKSICNRRQVEEGGRLPMATIRMPIGADAKARAGGGGLGPAFERPRDLARRARRDGEVSTICSPWRSAGCGRFLAFHDTFLSPGGGNAENRYELVRRRPRPETAPGSASSWRRRAFRCRLAPIDMAAIEHKTGGDQLASIRCYGAGAGARRRTAHRRDHRDLPLYRGAPSRAAPVRPRRVRQGVVEDMAAAGRAQPVNAVTSLSATSIRR